MTTKNRQDLRLLLRARLRARRPELQTAPFEGHPPNLSKDSKPLRWQITETFETTSEFIWEEIDMLEGDPVHRGMAKRSARFKPFWAPGRSIGVGTTVR